MPSSATIASLDIALADKIAYNLTSEFFAVTAIEDIITLQVVGALKNIYAIKSRLDQAAEQGENAKATLLVTVLKEIEILSKALGGLYNNSNILLEPGIVGDLILNLLF